MDGLQFSHPGQAPLFAGWSAHIAPGVTVLQGGESRGKSTLVRLLSGELAAQAGELTLRGIALRTHASAYRQHVLRTDPRSMALEQVTVDDHLAAQAAVYPGFDTAVCETVLHGLSLAEHRHKPFYMLSTGSRRKAWWAAACASGAALTLIDEPFAALDRASINFIVQWLREQSAHPGNTRAWVLADYETPAGLSPAAAVIDLG